MRCAIALGPRARGSRPEQVGQNRAVSTGQLNQGITPVLTVSGRATHVPFMENNKAAKKIVILGGYGVFGIKVTELLAAAGYQVWVAGRRRSKAEAAAHKFGCQALILDIHAKPERIFELAPDVVIDAAGPFQSYGTQGSAYRIPELCIEHKADYLDLSDDADFTLGLAALDERGEDRLARRPIEA